MDQTRRELRARFFKEDLAENPIPGDRVRVKGNPTNQALVGKTGIVRSRYVDYTVEIDGEYHHLTGPSLEIL